MDQPYILDSDQEEKEKGSEWYGRFKKISYKPVVSTSIEDIKDEKEFENFILKGDYKNIREKEVEVNVHNEFEKEDKSKEQGKSGSRQE